MAWTGRRHDRDDDHAADLLRDTRVVDPRADDHARDDRSQPDRRSEQEDAREPTGVGDHAEQVRPVDERREGHEHDVGDPAGQDARNEGGDRLAGEQLDRPDRRREDGLEVRACFSPMIENVAIESGM